MQTLLRAMVAETGRHLADGGVLRWLRTPKRRPGGQRPLDRIRPDDTRVQLAAVQIGEERSEAGS